jgi:hypothetical protein
MRQAGELPGAGTAGGRSTEDGKPSHHAGRSVRPEEPRSSYGTSVTVSYGKNLNSYSPSTIRL